MLIESIIKLVGTLSRGEKKKFRQAHLGSGSLPEYIRLYDLIVKYPGWEGKRIEKMFGKKGSNLANLRKKLWIRLIRFLASESPSPLKMVFDSTLVAAELIERNCFPEAAMVIKEGKEICEQHEYLSHHLELLELERNLPWASRSENLDHDRESVESKMAEIKELKEIHRLIPKGSFELKTNEPVVSLVKQLLNRTPLTDSDTKQTKAAQYEYLIVLRKIYRRSGKYRKAISFSEAIVDLLSKPCLEIQDSKEKLLVELIATLFLHEQLGDKERFEYYLHRIATLKTDTAKLQALKHSKFFIPKIISATDTANLALGEALIQSHLSDWKEMKRMIDPKTQLLIQFHVGKFYLTIGQFGKSWKWLEEFANSKNLHPNGHSFFYPYVLVMEIIVQLEKENVSLAMSRIETLKGFIANNNINLAYFNWALKVFTGILGSSIFDQKEILTSGLENLAPLETDAKEKHSFGFFNINYWILAKLRRVGICDIVTSLKEGDTVSQSSNY